MGNMGSKFKIVEKEMKTEIKVWETKKKSNHSTEVKETLPQQSKSGGSKEGFRVA